MSSATSAGRRAPVVCDGPSAGPRSRDRVQRLSALEIGLEHLGHAHRAVGLLVVLEQRDDRARHRACRAVERRERSHAFVEAPADARAGGPGTRCSWMSTSPRGTCPGWGSTPRSRTCGPPTRPEVAGSDVDHAERQLEHARATPSPTAAMRWCSAYDSSSVVYANSSTLSNQCTRKMPSVSLPYEPASLR